MMVSPDDPRYGDPEAVVVDLVDLLDELADDLRERAMAGNFATHDGLLTRAEMLWRRMCALVPPDVRAVHQREADAVLQRLHDQWLLIDVQGRA